jgi:hypothetical protein
MAKDLKYTEIFVPGGFPLHTYNPRAALQLEKRLGQTRENLCKLAAITGHTKSGKTVLARRVFPPEESVWIDGGSVGDEGDFWDSIIGQLDLFQSASSEAASETGGTIGGKASAEGSIVVAKAAGEASASVTEKTSSGETATRTVSSRVVALDGLRKGKKALVIDDFHYISKELQGAIVRALKSLIFEGLPVIIIAIPHRRYDAMKVEKEMTGRIEPIAIPVWEPHELEFIPTTGFELLGYSVSGEILKLLASEAIGSPHLTQDFCRTICRTKDLQKGSGDTLLEIDGEELGKVFHEVADTIGRPIFEKLARGPRQRSDRIPRKLKSGETVDIYSLVLHALAQIRPGLVTLEYEDLRTAIKEVSGGDIPQLQEVARVLKHMANISASDQSSTPVIDFEDEEKKLHITDPFFAFYLRWGSLAL